MKNVEANTFIVTCPILSWLSGECQDNASLAFSIWGENRQFQMIFWYSYKTTNELILLKSEPASIFHIERRKYLYRELEIICQTFGSVTLLSISGHDGRNNLKEERNCNALYLVTTFFKAIHEEEYMLNLLDLEWNGLGCFAFFS